MGPVSVRSPEDVVPPGLYFILIFWGYKYFTPSALGRAGFQFV
jgi:hypothetical protein